MNQVGAREGRVDIAALEADLVRDVGVATGMDEGRLRLQRLLGREDRGQLLVLDLDQVERVARDLFAGRRDGRDFLAGESHHVARQGEPLLVMHAPRHLRPVGTRHHRLHARKGERLRGVDAHDAGMRVGAAQHLPVQHAGELDVACVLRSPQHLGAGIDLGHRPAQRGCIHGSRLSRP